MKSDCDNPGIVLGFSGKIASGKTTLAESIARELDWTLVSFGGYVRGVAKERGLDSDDRKVLQDLGLEMLRADRAALCSNVLRLASFSGGDNLLVDGVRHPSIVDELQKHVAPSTFRLVYVYTKDSTRAERLDVNGQLLQAVSTHQVESEIEMLQAMADVRLPGDRSVEELTAEILEWLSGA